MDILVIDAQGGGIGRQIITALKKNFTGQTVTAVGTNSAATSAMLKAGADYGATGENAVAGTSRKAEHIIRPIGIVIAEALLCDITTGMAAAVGQSRAKRILIPVNHCDNYIVGVPDLTLAKLIDGVVAKIKSLERGGMDGCV